MKMSFRAVVGMLFTVLGLGCGGTPETTCKNGTSSCDGGCFSLTDDRYNCGACGNTCNKYQVCSQSKCLCAPGVPFIDGGCDGSSQKPYDTLIGCGVVGGSTSFDDAGTQNQVGRLFAFNSTTLSTSNALKHYQSIDAISMIDDTILYVEQGGVLRSARLSLSGTITPSVWITAIEESTSGIISDKDRAYIVSAGYSMLQVVQRGNDVFTRRIVDAGSPVLDDIHLRYGILAETIVGIGANAAGIAQSKDSLWITLPGGQSKVTALPFQSISRYSTPNAVGASKELKRYDLKSLDLKPFPDLESLARPAGIAVRGNIVYAALQNLGFGTFRESVTGGPGLLARIDPETSSNSDAVRQVELDDKCFQPFDIAVAGKYLVIACTGDYTFDYFKMSYTNYRKSGIVLIDESDKVVDFYSGECGGAANCTEFGVIKLAVVGNKILASIAGTPSLMILEINNGKIVPVRGPENPVSVCSTDTPGAPYIGAMFAIP